MVFFNEGFPNGHCQSNYTAPRLSNMQQPSHEKLSFNREQRQLVTSVQVQVVTVTRLPLPGYNVL